MMKKTRMSEIVSKLNSEMPDLNLIIDQQTGKVEGNTEAIQESIDKNLEWFKIQSAKKELVSLMEEQAEVELEIYKINEQIAEQEENGAGRERFVAISELNDKKKELIETEKEQLDQSSVLNEYIKDNTDLTSDNTAATQENATAVEEAGEIYTVYGEQVVGATEEVASAITELNENYESARTSAEDSLTSQIGLFQTASEQSSISVSEMTTNLATQTEAFNQYKDDLLAASDLVEGGLMEEGLLGYIESFGLEGAASLHELVSAAENDKDAFADLMAEWSDMEDAKNGLSNSMAEIETNYTDGMKNLGIIISNGNEEIKTSTVDLANGVGKNQNNLKDEFISTYDMMMVGANDSITSGTPKVTSSAKTLARNTITALNTELNVVGGKSLKAQSAGLAVAEGLAQGISSGTSVVSSAIQGMVSNAISNADFSGLTKKIDKAMGSALGK